MTLERYIRKLIAKEMLPPGSENMTAEQVGAWLKSEAERSRELVREAVLQAERADAEAHYFGLWADDERKRGRPESELTFGNFVKESGFWRPAPADAGDTK